MAIRTSDLCWLAGLLEGEGCFQTPRPGKSLSIDVQSSDKDVVGRVAFLFGSTLSGPYASSGANLISKSKRTIPYKERYSTKICGSKAAGWMMTLYSQLASRRRESVARAIKAWVALPIAHRDLAQCPAGHSYSGENLIVTKRGWRKCRECSRLEHSPSPVRLRSIRKSQTNPHG